MEDMKSKFLYACLGISICMNIFLGGYTLMNPPVCEYTHIDVIDRTKDYYKKDEAVRLAAASFGLAGWLVLMGKGANFIQRI